MFGIHHYKCMLASITKKLNVLKWPVSRFDHHTLSNSLGQLFLHREGFQVCYCGRSRGSPARHCKLGFTRERINVTILLMLSLNADIYLWLIIINSLLPKRMKGNDYAHASPLPCADHGDLVGVHQLSKFLNSFENYFC